jgi:thiamine biosynthesis lipoprotein
VCISHRNLIKQFLFPWLAAQGEFSYRDGTFTIFARFPMLAFLVLPLLSLLMLPVAAQADWFKQQQDIMGTEITVELWDEDNAHARQCAQQVFTEMRRIDALMSPYKPESELSRINQQAAKQAVKISEEMFNLLQKSIQVSELSHGAFDITFSSVGYLYDYRRGLKPSEQQIQQSLGAINFHHVQLDEKKRSVHFARSGVRIDLGGIAKGYAVDNGIAILQRCGIKGGLVSAGGDSRILGNRGDRPWMMGIRHPRKKQGVAVVLPLSDTAISTSGDYERFFIENGERYHHIISPKTGKSVSSSWSATVIGPDATTTDALSTTVFVLGPEKGLQLIESLAGIDAVIIDAQGQMHYSSGLMPPTTEPAPAGPEIR